MNVFNRLNVVIGLFLLLFGFVLLWPSAALVAQESDAIPLRLASGSFDPLRDSPPVLAPQQLAASQLSPAGEQFYLVQFDGPVDEADKSRLERAGVDIYDYVPNFAFLVRMDARTATAVGELDQIRWVGIHQTAFRLAPSLIETYFSGSGGGSTGVIDLVAVVPSAADLGRMSTAVEALGGTVTDRTSNPRWQNTLHLTIDAAQLANLAALDAISWVEPAANYTLFNSAAAGVTGINTIRTNNGLFGEGQIVAVADSGFDQGLTTVGNMHQDFEDHSNNSRAIALTDMANPSDGNPSDPVGSSGHGTHVAGTVLGNGQMDGSSAGNYANTEAGVAPQAQLYFQAINNSGNPGSSVSPPADLNDLFQPAYTAGARIHTNSWGASAAGAYNTNSRNVDEFAWDNKDMLILFAAGNDGTDGNNDGVIDIDSMGAPGTAKNVLTVGASENNYPAVADTWGSEFGYATAPISTDRLADDPTSGLAAFSSRGYTDDGRVKPDIVAPGSWVNSACALSECGVVDQYNILAGTSMATPHVAGASALAREYLVKQWYHQPSGALLKAILLNQATDIYPGQYGTAATQEIAVTRPSPQAGWGLLNLDDALFPVNPRRVWWWDHTDNMQSSLNNLTTGQTVTYTFEITQTDPLNVLMAWTDFPGSLLASGALVNDLDMVLEDPSGTLHYPNNATQITERYLSYDDGSLTNIVSWPNTTGEFAVRFTPGRYPATLNETQMTINSNSAGAKQWAVDIYADNAGGEPGTQICTVPVNVNLPGAGSFIVTINLSTCDGGSNYVINSGDFYIAFRQVVANDPRLVAESNAPIANRSWNSFNGTTWTLTAGLDYHVVAILDEPATSQDRVNNVIGIDLDTPATGTYTLTVDAYNIPQGPQPYALTVSGVGRLLGEESVTMPIDGAGTYIFGNTGISMTFTAEDIDSVTVAVQRDTFPTTNGLAAVVERLYNISSAGGSGTFTADVSFEYETAELNGQTAANLQAYRYNGSSWDAPVGTADPATRRVTVTGVTSFSPWVLGTSTPTAVTLTQTDTTAPINALPWLLTLTLLSLTGFLILRRRTASA